MKIRTMNMLMRQEFRSVALGLVFNVMCLPITKAQELKPEQLYKSTIGSVMTLSIEKNNGTLLLGTAFLAEKDGLAVTAWHLVKDAKSVVGKFSDGEKFEASGLVDKDERRDIALIRMKVFGRPLLKLVSDDPDVGSKAYVIGSPRGLEFTISEGLVSQLQTVDSIKQYQFSCAASPGNSGGPLLNAKGEVLGVVSWQVREGQNLNFAIPAKYVLGLDATLPTQPWDKVQSTLASAAFDTRPNSGLSVDSFVGRVHNLSMNLTAYSVILVEEHEGRIKGCFGVRRPLYGTGPLQGSVEGNEIQFDVTSPPFYLHFEGIRSGRKLSGTYTALPKIGGAKQQGEFFFEQQDLERNFKNFDPETDCPTDADMNH